MLRDVWLVGISIITILTVKNFIIYNYLLECFDSLSQISYNRPSTTQTGIISEQKLFNNNLWKIFFIPNIVISFSIYYRFEWMTFFISIHQRFILIWRFRISSQKFYINFYLVQKHRKYSIVSHTISYYTLYLEKKKKMYHKIINSNGR